MVKNFKGPNEILCDGVVTVSKFSYVGDRLNANGGCKTAVTARTKIGCMSSGNTGKYSKAEGFH